MWLCSSVWSNSQSLLRPCAWNNRPYVWMAQPKWEPKVTWRTWSASVGQRRISQQRRGLWWYTASVAYEYEAGGHAQGGYIKPHISGSAPAWCPADDSSSRLSQSFCCWFNAGTDEKCPRTHIYILSQWFSTCRPRPLWRSKTLSQGHISDMLHTRYLYYDV